MERTFKVIMGCLTVTFVTAYFLAVMFAPFGIVWLVLAH